MTYQQAIKYIYNLERFGIKLGLQNIKQVLEFLGNPQDNLNIVHIAGTNGKGSTAAFIYFILKEAGYKVGLYTSPHLMDFRERIQINGKFIPKKEVVRFVNFICSTHNAQFLTYFEFTTIMAFLYFAQQKIDFAVVEVGMGGRLDATNVIKKSLVSVITNIDFEHTAYLGKSLTEITLQKCGIIKKKGQLISATSNKISLGVIKEICCKKKAKLFQIGKDLNISDYKLLSNGQQIFTYKGMFGNIKNLRIKMLGKHQTNNALCALGAIEVLKNYGYQVKKRYIRQGLEKTVWPGRLEIFKLPTVNYQLITVLLDGAHNPAGIKSLRNYFEEGILKFNRCILIFGVLSDKNIKQMLNIILPLANIAIITKSKSKRAVEPEVIIEQMEKSLLSIPIILAKDVQSAIYKALSLVRKNDLICVTGSLYVVGEARQMMNVNKKCREKILKKKMAQKRIHMEW